MGNMMELIVDAIKKVFLEMYNSAETEEQKAELRSKFEKTDWSSFILRLFDNFKQETFSVLKSSMFEQVYMKLHNDEEFLARLMQTWFRAFAASEALYILVLEAVSNHDKRISMLSEDNRKEKNYCYIALKFIHGRVLQQFLEVLTLMKNGLADGAFSRWRSMYELGIIAQFIYDEPEEVAQSYINSRDDDNKYAWASASDIFKNKKKIRFCDIEKNASFSADLWKDKFNLACSIIHPSSRGTFGRLAHMEGEELSYVPVGRCNYGMTVPAECSAIILSQVTALLMSIHEQDVEAAVAIDCIVQWVNFIREEYFKAHDYAFPNSTPMVPLIENKNSIQEMRHENENSI